MSRQQLLAYPYVDELKYRSKIDPYKMNLMLRSIEESVLRSILRGSESKEQLQDLNLSVISSYAAMAAQSVRYLHLYSIPEGIGFADSFRDVLKQGARTDYVGGITTLDWNTNRQYTKIPRYDSDNDGIPDLVSPSVVMLLDGSPRNPDNKIYNCLNRSNRSFWIEEATTGEHTIEIQLPPSLNKNFNYIELAPLPVFGMKIKRVEYQDSRSNYQTIYDSNIASYKFYSDVGPLVMHLAPKETNGTFRITVEALAGINAIGFSSIEIALIDYIDTQQTAYLTFWNIGTGNITLEYLDLDFYVDGATDYSNFITELAITNAANPLIEVKKSITTISHDRYYFNGEQIMISDKMYLKVVLKENNMTTPVIRGCKLKYEV